MLEKKQTKQEEHPYGLHLMKELTYDQLEEIGYIELEQIENRDGVDPILEPVVLYCSYYNDDESCYPGLAIFVAEYDPQFGGAWLIRNPESSGDYIELDPDIYHPLAFFALPERLAPKIANDAGSGAVPEE